MKIYFLLVLLLVVTVAACQTVAKKTAFKKTVPGNLSIYTNALYPIVVNGKWGYMNNKFETVIAPQFIRAEDFYEGMAAVAITTTTDGSDEQKELWGYIDSTGKVIIAYQYEQATFFKEGYAAVGKNNLFGYVDKTGREVIPLQYHEASVFAEGLACVNIDGKNGFINKTANVVIAPQYHRATWVSDFSEGLAAVYTSMDGPGGYIDKTGNMVIPAVYSHVGRFHEGLALVKPMGSNKFGYINQKGDMVIAPKYLDGLHFSEGVATVRTALPNGKTVCNIIDKTGKILAANLPYAFAGIFREGLAGVETFNQRWGFINKTGNEVIAPQFAGVKLFHHGLSRMETGHLFNGLKTVYINTSGKIVWQE